MGYRPHTGGRALSRRKCDRLLRTVLLTDNGVLLEFTGDVCDAHYRVSDLVGIENVGRERVAASMPGAALSVDGDAGHCFTTGNVSGSDSTDRSAAVYVSCVPGGIS